MVYTGVWHGHFTPESENGKIPGWSCILSVGALTLWGPADGCQFPAMIADWRSRFATPWVGTPHELTFIFVGLPAYVQDLLSTRKGK